LVAYQKVNHFPKSFEITRKDLLYHNLTKAGGRHKGLYNFVPRSYVLPSESSRFLEEGSKFSSVYIVKPHNSSQGRGIWLSASP
jgi:tubulin polyglutamylase TTLL5